MRVNDKETQKSSSINEIHETIKNLQKAKTAKNTTKNASSRVYIVSMIPIMCIYVCDS